MGTIQPGTSTAPGVLRLVATGEFDMLDHEEFRATLRRALRSGSGDVQLDAAGVRFMDVRCVGILTEASRAAQDAGRSLGVVNASAAVRHVLHALGEDGLLLE